MWRAFPVVFAMADFCPPQSQPEFLSFYQKLWGLHKCRKSGKPGVWDAKEN